MLVLIPARTRRHFLSTLAVAGGGLLYAPGVFAEELALTPRQTEGPFYPDQLPLDTDNDLIVVNDALTPAVGEDHAPDRHAFLDAKGDPIRNAVVEIWQCDAQRRLPAHRQRQRRQARQAISRASAASSPARRANTTSAPSSRCPIPAARRTSTSRSSRAARNC